MEAAFSLENLADQWDEFIPLTVAHYREIAKYQDIPLSPNKAKYMAINDAGLLRCFTARLHGQLIGYAVYLVDYHLHYSTSLQAMQDVLYLATEYRNGSLGSRLIDYADAALAAEGVQVITQHVKVAHNFGPLLERKGYEPMDALYTKRLY